MSKDEIIRAWKDANYRMGLPQGERDRLPDHPAGELELGDLDLEIVAGGRTNRAPVGTCPCGSQGCTCGSGCGASPSFSPLQP